MILFCFQYFTVAQVGFTAALYTVEEGEEEEVTVCVSILSGDITDLIFLEFNLSTYPFSAAGIYKTSIHYLWNIRATFRKVTKNVSM